MKRPERIRILGKPFKIVYCSGTEPLADDQVGECDPDKQQILVRDGAPLESEQDTLLHELLHALDEATDAKMKETQVKKMATALLAVLKDNDEFVGYLQKKPCAACGAPDRSLNRPYCSPCNVKKVREWQKAHPEAKRRHDWRRRYKLSEQEHAELVRKQDGLCANVDCGRPATDVDHDHATGAVRGLLCGHCNKALGLLRDDPAKIEGLIHYLTAYIRKNG
jgi:hypothetical protein